MGGDEKGALSPVSPVGRRASRGPGTAETAARPVPRSRLPAGRRAAGVQGDGRRREGGSFPGVTGRPPGLSRSRDSGNGGAAGAPLTAVGRAPDRRGARGWRRRRGGAVPRSWLSAAGRLAVRGQRQRRHGRCPARACWPGGGSSGCQGECSDEKVGRLPGLRCRPPGFLHSRNSDDYGAAGAPLTGPARTAGRRALRVDLGKNDPKNGREGSFFPRSTREPGKPGGRRNRAGKRETRNLTKYY